jgi:glycosyltransferase involved in cell wall biosynthesis
MRFASGPSRSAGDAMAGIVPTATAAARGFTGWAPAGGLTIVRQSRTPRMAPCPCGSAKPYKQCCGSLQFAQARERGQDDTPIGTQTALLNRAIECMRRGEGAKAEAIVRRLRADSIDASEIALVAGEICIDLHRLAEASMFLARASALAPENPEIYMAREACRRLDARAQAWQAAALDLRARLERMARRARPVQAIKHVHIVSKLDAIGGTERRAMNLHRCLLQHTPVTLWSTVPVAGAVAAEAPARAISAASYPDGGMLVVVGTYFACDDWLESAAFARIAICHNLAEQHESLGQLLARLESHPSRPCVELVFPSRYFRDLSGLPGRVEYSPVDIEAFCPRRSVPDSRRRLRVGRHGRAYPYKFHPNDPAFFRGLLARGYDVRLLGGSVIAAAFAGDTTRPDLLDVGAVGAAEFLDSLDIFVYRKQPGWIETGGTVILEAMAMALPVVVFRGDCGYAELIVDGENGFLVSDEMQANACIDRLSGDPALRVRIGRAARATIVDLMRRQEADLVRFHLQRGAG